jgi:tetratricopeptide (TPR) repeat protein
MNVRIRAAYLFGLSVFLGGCAGGPGPEAVLPQPPADDDLPAWVLALPEGTPPSDTNETNQAALFLAQGQFQTALESAQAGIQADPTNAMAYLAAGQAYIGLGNYEGADEMLTRAEELYPRYALDVIFLRETEWIEHFNAAVAAMPTGGADAAIPSLERAHSIYRGRPEAMVQLGALYAQDNRTEDALEMFSMAVEMLEGPIAQREEDPTVLATYAENLEVSRYNIAQISFDLGRYAEAAEMYRVLSEENPDDLLLRSNYGAALIAGGQAEQASTVYSDLLAQPGLTAVEYNQIAIGAYNGDLFLQAAEAFGLASQQLPQSRDFIYNQAQSLYLAENAYEDLVEVSSRLITVDTHSRTARQFLVQGLARLERMEEAAEALNALEGLPFDIAELQLVPADGGYIIPGLVTNRTADPGSAASIRFRLYDVNGTVVGSQELSLTLDEVEVGLEFEVEIPTTAQAIAYNYEVL